MKFETLFIRKGHTRRTSACGEGYSLGFTPIFYAWNIRKSWAFIVIPSPVCFMPKKTTGYISRSLQRIYNF